ncbi:MAG: ATP-binding cassette domain-containing protein [Gammaproteobacteria bacterium]|nr:ATP-binding cassette domain-containing protein [Gammaproteobacteria bacterium]
MDRMDAVLTVKDLQILSGENILLEQLNFELHHGEILMVLGDSGCGKSTLIRTLIGLETYQQGTVVISDDPDCRATTPMKMGMTFQSGALLGSMSLLENLMLPLKVHTDLTREAVMQIALEKLKLVGLKKFGHYLPAELSGGMLKRAAIARALILEPEILFLDEPSAGLDPVTSANLDELIQSLATSLQLSFIIVTHELSSVFSIADRIILLNKDQQGIVAIGTPQEVIANSDNAWVQKFLARGKE